jgi:hypothetical protein
MDMCYVPNCTELAAGFCQWCSQPVGGKHSICVNGPNFLYFYLCDNCHTSKHYTILSNRILHQSEQTIQVK